MYSTIFAMAVVRLVLTIALATVIIRSGYRIGYRDMTDNGIDVLFRFDENNRVDMMVLNFASGMP